MNSFNFTENNNLMNRVDELINRGQIRCVTINGTNLIVYANGDIYRHFKGGDWRLTKRKIHVGEVYNRISCNGKKIRSHRIIGHAFLNLDINDPKKHIDHINGNTNDNSINNLRVVNHQQNQWNRTKAKGYYFNKNIEKYQAQIYLNNKNIHLGLFNTTEDARQAYLNAKLIYHQIN